MARKRGGLAGIWDRNKGIIKTLAPIALGAIPGVGVPLAAAAGAAMGGLDRPGKGGIGLDIGGAIKGGVTGYLGGQTGKGIAGGVKSLLAPKADISSTLAKTSGMLDEANAQILSKPAFGGAPTNFVQVTGGGMPAAEIDAMRQSARAAAERAGNIPRPMNTAPQLTMSQAASPPSMVTGVSPSVSSAARSVAPSMTSAAGGPVTSTDYIGRSVNQFLAQGGSTAPSASGAFGRAAADRAFGDLGMSLSDVANANKSASSGGGRLQGLLRGFRENKDLISMAGKGIMAGMPDRGEEAAMMRAETERMMFEDEKAQREARQRALQQYFMPMLGQIQQERQGMSFGPMYRG